MSQKQIRTNVSFDKALHEKLRKYAFDNKISLNKAVTHAVSLFFQVEEANLRGR